MLDDGYEHYFAGGIVPYLPGDPKGPYLPVLWTPELAPPLLCALHSVSVI